MVLVGLPVVDQAFGQSRWRWPVVVAMGAGKALGLTDHDGYPDERTLPARKP